MTDPDTRKLFVAGLSETISEIELRRMFEAAGASVEDVAVPRDRQTGKARGFGFITLASEDQAEQVRDALDGSLHEGRPISVRPFRGNRTGGSPSQPPRPFVAHAPSGGGGADREDRENTLFLANLPSDCRDDELTEIFKDAGVGPILKLHMPVDPDGRRRGFGFVSLRDATAAREAVPKLRERMLRGRPLTVDVARPRGERPGASGERPAMGGGAWRSRPPPPRDGGGAMHGGSSSGGPPMRTFSEGGAPPVERQTWDERRDPNKRKKEPSAKKKKAKAAERGHSRRENEGFRAPRARGLMDDWDKDE
jgi:RNA recognition motif-containing protein